MGILSDIADFFTEKEEVPVVASIVPPEAARLIRLGKLPQFHTRTVMLMHDEVCRFIDKAVLVTTKDRKKYHRNSTGVGLKVTKGLTIFNSSGITTPVEHRSYIYTKGILYITDTRIIFAAQDGGFEKKIANLTSVTPYINATGLQFGSQTYNLLLPQPDLVADVLHILFRK